MKNILWRVPTTDSEAHRRAGGRRRYNAERQRQAKQRLEKVLNLRADGLTQAEIARRLGVHRSTVSRDLKPFKTWPPSRKYYRYGYTADYDSTRRPPWRVW